MAAIYRNGNSYSDDPAQGGTPVNTPTTSDRIDSVTPPRPGPVTDAQIAQWKQMGFPSKGAGPTTAQQGLPSPSNEPQGRFSRVEAVRNLPRGNLLGGPKSFTFGSNVPGPIGNAFSGPVADAVNAFEALDKIRNTGGIVPPAPTQPSQPSQPAAPLDLSKVNPTDSKFAPEVRRQLNTYRPYDPQDPGSGTWVYKGVSPSGTTSYADSPLPGHTLTRMKGGGDGNYVHWLPAGTPVRDAAIPAGMMNASGQQRGNALPAPQATLLSGQSAKQTPTWNFADMSSDADSAHGGLGPHITQSSSQANTSGEQSTQTPQTGGQAPAQSTPSSPMGQPSQGQPVELSANPTADRPAQRGVVSDEAMARYAAQIKAERIAGYEREAADNQELRGLRLQAAIRDDGEQGFAAPGVYIMHDDGRDRIERYNAFQAGANYNNGLRHLRAGDAARVATAGGQRSARDEMIDQSKCGDAKLMRAAFSAWPVFQARENAAAASPGEATSRMTVFMVVPLNFAEKVRQQRAIARRRCVCGRSCLPRCQTVQHMARLQHHFAEQFGP